MSVIAYTGLPGSGKSYSAVENVILPSLEKGRTVYHNMRLNDDELLRRSGGKGKLVQFEKATSDSATSRDALIKNCPAGAVCVIDEVWQYYGAGLRPNDLPREHVAFWKEHRHSVETDIPDERSSQGPMAMEILLLDQEMSSGIAKFIRDLVEQTYIHTKVTKATREGSLYRRFLKKIDKEKYANGTYRVDVYARAQPNENPKRTRFLRQMFGHYKPDIFACYISHTANSEQSFGNGVLEEIADDRGKWWKSWKARIAIASLFILPFCAWSAYSSFQSLGTVSGSAPSANGHSAQGLKQSSLSSRPKHEATTVKRSTQWRFAGIFTRNGSQTVYIQGPRGGRRISASKCDIDSMGQWQCLVNGEIVDETTGPDPSTMVGIPALSSQASSRNGA